MQYVFTFLISTGFGLYIGFTLASQHCEQDAIKTNVAHYNAKTAKFEFKECKEQP